MITQSEKDDVLELEGKALPALNLSATNGDIVNLSKLGGVTVIYIYPRTSPPNGRPIEGWSEIPGAKGCTPQSCAFRDYFTELKESGASRVFGLSSQNSTYQNEMAGRLHLPFPILSDQGLNLAKELKLPTFSAGGMTLFKRITLIIRDGKVEKAFCPIPDPEKNASDVIAFLRTRQK
jgi:peroxiredoxin